MVCHDIVITFARPLRETVNRTTGLGSSNRSTCDNGKIFFRTGLRLDRLRLAASFFGMISDEHDRTNSFGRSMCAYGIRISMASTYCISCGFTVNGTRSAFHQIHA